MGTGILKVNDNGQISAVDSKLFRVIFMKLKKKKNPECYGQNFGESEGKCKLRNNTTDKY